MRSIAIILFATIITVFQGCTGNDEECAPCNTPPQSFMFNIVNDETNKNIFSEGELKSSDIEIINTDDNKKIEDKFIFIDGNNLNYIQIPFIGWKTEKVNLMFKVKDKEIFMLFVDAERLTEDCCTFTRYNKVEIKGAKYEQGKNNVYTIKTDKF